MSPPPTNIDGTEITGATIDGTEVTEITVDGQTVFTAADEIPIRSGLQNEYTVSETSGTTVADSVGTNDWTLNGATLQSDSVFFDGAYASFDGTNDFASLSDIPFIDSGSAFSITFGCVVQDASKASLLFSNKRSTGSRISIGTGNGASGRLETAIFDGSSFLFDDFYDISSGGLNRVGDRILVTLTWDGSSVGAFYLDDSNTAQSGSNAVTAFNNGIAVGRRAGSDQAYFDGRIDLGLAYNRELSASEVSDIHSAWL